MARRRCRHFNPATAKCQVAFDARFITGIANGGAVETWTGRPGTSVNATQATGVSQPTLQLTGINGRAALQFDGSNDMMTLNAGTLFANVGSGYMLSVCRDDNHTAGAATHMALNWTTNAGLQFIRVTLYTKFSSPSNTIQVRARRLDGDAQVGSGTFAGNGNNNLIGAEARWSAGNLNARLNGVASTNGAFASSGNTSSGSSLAVTIGADHFTGNGLPGHISTVVAASPLPSTEMVKRLEHAAGRSFNLPLVA
jgi:hypothetical protein